LNETYYLLFVLMLKSRSAQAHPMNLGHWKLEININVTNIQINKALIDILQICESDYDAFSFTLLEPRNWKKSRFLLALMVLYCLLVKYGPGL